ncbi:MAG: L,D-transpeptidase family protein [Betaproteobacteria bacterium]|nr:L,D-transpeptidase family protein [Betaproteobacteria bacterium]
MRRAAAFLRIAAAALVLPLACLASSPEPALSGVVEAIEANHLDLALQRVEKLVAEHPTFRLAHLIRGDLLLARGRPLQIFGNVVKTVPREKVEDLRAEALVRLRALRERPGSERLPRAILQLHPGQKHALVVDSRRSRLYVFENIDGRPHYLADYYVSLGKRGVDKAREGDQKTPIGVYHVTANLPRQKLSDFYGAGAYPINYPNEWDRQRGRNGFGIWVHGTPPDTYSRPPRASDGCIVLANPDLLSVGSLLQVGMTPVIITDEIEWADADTLEAERGALAGELERWRADWESRDTDRYLAHYAADFRSASQNLGAWSRHKRGVNAAKSWIRVSLAKVSMLRYPREADFVAVTFEQGYRSSNLSNTMRKLQYWKKENGRWRILYEGSA